MGARGRGSFGREKGGVLETQIWVEDSVVICRGELYGGSRGSSMKILWIKAEDTIREKWIKKTNPFQNYKNNFSKIKKKL